MHLHEQGNSTPQPVPLLQQLVQKNDDQPSNNKLDDEKHANASTKVRWQTIETGKNKHTGLAKANDNCEKLLRGLVPISISPGLCRSKKPYSQLAVCFEIQVYIDKVGTGKKLKDHSRAYDGGCAQFHQRAAITSKHHTQPVKRIRVV